MKARTGFMLTLVCCGTRGHSQAPSIAIGLDLNPRVTATTGGKALFRMNDDEGNFSRVRFSANFDNGLSLRVFQRIERIKGDADTSTLDEAFVERPGDWRIGKQYLPFGAGRVVKESAFAAKVDMEILFANMPISVAAVDGGEGRQRGFCARFGDNIGFSIAKGARFGINASSFTQIRSPENSAGKRRGYQFMAGADMTKQTGGWTASAEWVRLREGESADDLDEDLIEGSLSYQFPYGPLVQVESTAQLHAHKTHYRVSAEVPIASNAFLSPSVRYMQGEGWHYSVTMRIRL